MPVARRGGQGLGRVVEEGKGGKMKHVFVFGNHRDDPVGNEEVVDTFLPGSLAEIKLWKAVGSLHYTHHKENSCTRERSRVSSILYPRPIAVEAALTISRPLLL